jgi:hypothetical protein
MRGKYLFENWKKQTSLKTWWNGRKILRKIIWKMYVGPEVLTAVVMNLCDVTPCSPLQVTGLFGGNISPPSSRSRNKVSKKPAWKQVASRARLYFNPEWRRYVPPKFRVAFNDIRYILSQKTVLFLSERSRVWGCGLVSSNSGQGSVACSCIQSENIQLIPQKVAISWLAERLLDSSKELSSMELV